MKSSSEFIELTAKLQKLFIERDNSYTLCVVIGDIECALLRFLYKANKPLRMREIARMYEISNAKVTRVLNKLVKMGFVERYHSDDDRRSWFARITDEGLKMAENTSYKLNKFQEEVLELIPDNEIDKTYSALKTFVDAYEKIITDSTKKTCEIS
ncbi:MAG: MarR family transcriptional regulator [Candidatus Tenebribacter mawsonii]|nr:MarR family transcriptional regulator [Candidatus Tenebribacter mawsonii]